MNKHDLKVHLSGPWAMEGGNLTAPAVMMVPGVHCGSAGCLLWQEGLLRASVPKWRNIPLTLGHPVNEDGIPLSINHSQQVYDQYKIGHISNVRYAGGGLRADLTVTKRDQQTRALVQSLKEVSVGVFTEDEAVTGRLGNEQFEARVREIRPDHTAILLPGSVGACSFEDGCGIRANSAAIREIMINAAREVLQTKDANFFNKLFQGGETMTETAPLLPGDVQREIDKKESITINEREWEADGLLMPPEVRTEMYRQRLKGRQERGEGERDEDDEDLLMLPPGLL